MKGKVSNILFVVVIIGVIGLFAYRKAITDYMHDRARFDLTSIQMEDMLGYEAYIPPGMNGYVVFYTDMEGCTTCLGKIAELKRIAENFEGVGFFAILKERGSRQPFGEFMAKHEFPGESYQDPNKILQKRLGLSKHPLLMFFDRGGGLVAALPLDVDHGKLVQIIYAYLEEM